MKGLPTREPEKDHLFIDYQPPQVIARPHVPAPSRLRKEED